MGKVSSGSYSYTSLVCSYHRLWWLSLCKHDSLFLLRVIILWLIIYSIIYALLPQTSVRKYYKSWLKRYKGTTRLWSVLYWVVCVIIAFTVATCRGRWKWPNPKLFDSRLLTVLCWFVWFWNRLLIRLWKWISPSYSSRPATEHGAWRQEGIRRDLYSV